MSSDSFSEKKAQDRICCPHYKISISKRAMMGADGNSSAGILAFHVPGSTRVKFAPTEFCAAQSEMPEVILFLIEEMMLRRSTSRMGW